ncbi:MAG: hypothetical protein ACYS8L_10945 [Planctomycetota bacterium]|jgi:hypothetical protein
MIDSSLYLALAIAVLVAAALAVVLSSFKHPGRILKERSRRLYGMAEGLGLRYYGAVGQEGLAFLPACSLFGKGEVRKVANLIGEKRIPPRLAMFDYEFRTLRGMDGAWSGDIEEGVLYLVAMARLPDAPQEVLVTRARVYQEDWFGGPTGVKDLYRLQTKEDPDFGRRFVIAGEPREEVCAMLTRAVRDAIKAWTVRGPKPVVEIVPGWVVVYMESEPGDRQVAHRAAYLLDYTSRIGRGFASGAEGASLES